MKLYTYLFYRCFDLLSLVGKNDVAGSSVHMLSIVISVLSIKLASFVIDDILIVGGIGIINYFISAIVGYIKFEKDLEYESVLESYSWESDKRKKEARVLTLISLLFIIFFLFV